MPANPVDVIPVISSFGYFSVHLLLKTYVFARNDLSPLTSIKSTTNRSDGVRATVLLARVCCLCVGCDRTANYRSNGRAWSSVSRHGVLQRQSGWKRFDTNGWRITYAMRTVCQRPLIMHVKDSKVILYFRQEKFWVLFRGVARNLIWGGINFN